MPRTKLLTDYAYSPTNPASEDAIREQIDGSIQEVYDFTSTSDLSSTNVPAAIEEVYAKARATVPVLEITDARTSSIYGEFNTLKERLDNTDVRFNNLSIVNVKDFGAVGNGIDDDTNEIKDAINYSNNIKTEVLKPTLYFPFSSGYKTTENIIIPHGINVIMDSPIIYDGILNEPALTIGETNINGLGLNYKLNVLKNVQSDWSNENCIGIKLINITTSEIIIEQTKGFTIGVQFIGSVKGFSYNKITLNYISNNKIGIDLTNELYGWCNENSFYDGRFSILSGTNTTLSRFALRITSKDNLYVNNNNNVFYKPSFELNKPNTTADAIPCLFEHSFTNKIYNCRNENNSDILAIFSNDSSYNLIEVGYGSSDIDDQTTNKTNVSFRNDRLITEKKWTQIFKCSALHKKACYYNGSTVVNVPTVHCATTTSAITNATSSVTINNNYLEILSTRGLGIIIDTSINKRFVIRRDVESGNGGRVSVRCYDVNGVVLTSSDPNHPYVSDGFTFATNHGGVYRTGIDSSADYFFEVKEDVKQIALICSGGTSPLRIRGFEVECLDGYCSAWAGYEEITPGTNLMTTPPTSGTWNIGRRGVNATPTVGQPKSWICTVSGTPGTWVSEGNL